MILNNVLTSTKLNISSDFPCRLHLNFMHDYALNFMHDLIYTICVAPLPTDVIQKRQILTTIIF